MADDLVRTFASQQTTTCDGCNREFQILLRYAPRYRDTKPVGEVASFACPNCGKAWQFAYVTQRGVRIRPRLAEAHERQRAHPSDANAAAVMVLERQMQEETRPLGDVKKRLQEAERKASNGRDEIPGAARG